MVKDQASADKDTTAAQRLALAAGGATKGAGDIVDNEVAADVLKVGGKYHKIGSGANVYLMNIITRHLGGQISGGQKCKTVCTTT